MPLFFLKLEAIIEIWAFPYREIQRKTAGGGYFLRFGHFPIGKYKGEPPEAENLSIFGHFPIFASHQPGGTLGAALGESKGAFKSNSTGCARVCITY